MAKQRGWKKIRQSEFDRIRVLVEAKIPTAMIARATKRSYQVIQTIERAKTLEAYHQLMREAGNGIHVNKKQSAQNTESLGTAKPEERFPRLVALLDTIVKQQLVLLQDVAKIKRRLLIKS